MSLPSAWPQIFNFFGSLTVVEPSKDQLTGAGLPPVGQFGERTSPSTARRPPRHLL
jgi:hypothetical protein